MLTFCDPKLPDLASEELKGHTSIEVAIDAPLTKADAQALLDSLHKLANKVTLCDLDLAICCSCSTDIAEILVDGLTPLQGLKNLALKLNNQPIAEILALTKATVMSLVRSTSTARGPFPFDRLPTEIRQKILGYTSLVPEIIEGTTLWDEKGLRIGNGFLLWPRGHCCQKCTNSLKHCACWTRRGAYSTTCTCFEYPWSFFRVNRSFYKDSTYVCFSQNRFLLAGDTSADNVEFLHCLPDEALRAIRQLDILIDDEQVKEFSKEDSDEQQNFRTLVGLIAQKCNLPVLHFALDTGFLCEEYALATDDTEWLRGTYHCIANALMPLSSVDRFEMFFSEYCEEEEVCEKKVKGEAYNALARGKNHWSRRWELAPHSPYNR